MSQKRIAIFGSTGSIGKQTLEVIAAHPELFVAEILTAHSNESLLIEQALVFMPNIVVIVDLTKYATVKKALEGKPIKVFAGEAEAVQLPGLDGLFQVLNGHAPIISALKEGVVKIDLATAFEVTEKTSDLIEKDAKDAKIIRVTIKGGVAELTNNKLIVLAE